jgi:hypothetical protein
MTMRAEALQLSGPELHWIVVMRFDVIGDASCDHSAFGQAHSAQRLHAQLMAGDAMPSRFIVQLTH